MFNNAHGETPAGNASKEKTIKFQRILTIADNEPKNSNAIMSALVWGAATSEIAHRAAFEFKRFSDAQGGSREYLVQIKDRQLIVAPAIQQENDPATPVPLLVYNLDEHGLVI